jgi:D-glycero-beta-D-manno-heptose 1-phosphate adenylyltransferase
MKTVFTNGCFDILTVGHFNLLSYCRKLAGPDGKVIVALDSDRKIKEDKGPMRPIYPHLTRLAQLMDLVDSSDKMIVNKIFPFDTNKELYEIIKTEKPDIIVKGSEWKGNVIGSDLAEVVLCPKLYSSTKIIDTIRSKQITTPEDDEWVW